MYNICAFECYDYETFYDRSFNTFSAAVEAIENLIDNTTCIIFISLSYNTTNLYRFMPRQMKLMTSSLIHVGINKSTNEYGKGSKLYYIKKEDNDEMLRLEKKYVNKMKYIKLISII